MLASDHALSLVLGRGRVFQKRSISLRGLLLDLKEQWIIHVAPEEQHYEIPSTHASGARNFETYFRRAVAIEQHLAVNLFGLLNVTRAFLPLLKRSKGAVVNNLSTSALAALPIIPGYSISKAAMLSMTQSLRALLAGQGVTVHAILTGPVDTDMTRSVDFPKASPESVAVAIFDGVEKGEEEIFPDPMSQSIAEGWRNGVVKALERQVAVFVPESVAL